MRKKILSMSIAAVLTAVTSSSVMAFDATGTDNAYGDGPIVVYPGLLHALKSPSKLAAYRTPLKAAPANTSTENHDLQLEPEGRGDALIYPLYKAKDGWGTEIIVRNTDSEHAIVAKVSLRRKIDSLEVFDFNIYLSADDVARFTIKEHAKGGIEIRSEDGSILRRFPAPSSNGNDVTKDDFASKDKPFIANEDTANRMIKKNGALVKLTDAGVGYVVIFGMGEAKGKVDNKGEDRYHDDHVRLFANYRKELDVCREPWRRGHSRAMLNGTYIRNTIISTDSNGDNTYSGDVNFSIPAPNQAEDCAVNDAGVSLGPGRAGNFFGDVNQNLKNGLTGTVRLFTASNDGVVSRDATRDMILPAVAVKNFTDRNKIIYTEGEIASLQDRRIEATVNPVPDSADFAHPPESLDLNDHTPHYWANYNEAKISDDAKVFLVNRTTYTFDAESVSNQLIVTQPYKRILVQLGNDDHYWQSVAPTAYLPDHFGGFSYIYNVYNEHEKMSNIAYTESPYNSFSKILRPELASMSNMERCTEFDAPPSADQKQCPNESQLESDRKRVNGFARLWFTNEAAQRAPIPAIVTQMIGSAIDIGGVGAPVFVPELNWIYSQFRKP